MKKPLLVLTVFLLFASGGIHAQQMNLEDAVESAARAVEEVLPQEAMVAVLNFASSSEAFSDYVIEELTGELVMGRKVTVVDRHNLLLIREEMNLQLSGDVSDESAQAIGKMLGAESIVSGTLANMGTFYRFRVRAIDVETAAIQTQVALDLRNDSQVAFLLGTDPSGLPAPESSLSGQNIAPPPRSGDDFTLAIGARAGVGLSSTAFGPAGGGQVEFILKRRFSIQLDYRFGVGNTYEGLWQSYWHTEPTTIMLVGVAPKFNFYPYDRFVFSSFLGVGLDINWFNEDDNQRPPPFYGFGGIEGAFLLGESRRWSVFADLRVMYAFEETYIMNEMDWRSFPNSPVFDFTLGVKYRIPVK